jgi:hypothetical protein
MRRTAGAVSECLAPSQIVFVDDASLSFGTLNICPTMQRDFAPGPPGARKGILLPREQ